MRIYNILLEFYVYDTVSLINMALCLSYKTWDFKKVHYYYLLNVSFMMLLF